MARTCIAGLVTLSLLAATAAIDAEVVADDLVLLQVKFDDVRTTAVEETKPTDSMSRTTY